MADIFMSFIVVIVLAVVTAGLALTYPPAMRRWIWLALLEYLLCAAAQVVYAYGIVKGGDTILYARTGTELVKVMDANFGWAGPEVIALLFQQESVFDAFVYGGGGSNTGSMHATAALLIFVVRSEYAAHVLVSGCAFFGALSIFNAFRQAYRDVPPVRLFVAAVLFPSTAFWTSALHKEAFCFMGIGLLLAGWRAIYLGRWFRVLLFVPSGFALILLFRAPAIVPILLGLVVYFVIERLQKIRGAEAAILGPVYFGFALALLALGMVAFTRVAPTLAVDRLGDTMAIKQQNWALSRGGSSFGGDDLAPQSLAGQLLRLPIGLVNALFRPQLFDVNNFGALLSAIEMTIITWLIIRAFRLRGFFGTLIRIQRSPFLLMCTIVTLVGCAFVGLVTLNFGSMARYRVPFLPFYGALVIGLAQRTASTQATGVKARAAATGRRHKLVAPARSPRALPVPRA